MVWNSGGQQGRRVSHNLPGEGDNLGGPSSDDTGAGARERLSAGAGTEESCSGLFAGATVSAPTLPASCDFTALEGTQYVRPVLQGDCDVNVAIFFGRCIKDRIAEGYVDGIRMTPETAESDNVLDLHRRERRSTLACFPVVR
jgi:hypothetical protein